MVRVSGLVIALCLLWTVTHISPDSKAHPTAFLEQSPMGRMVQQEWYAAQAATAGIQWASSPDWPATR